MKSAITLDSEDVEDTKHIEGNTDDNYPVEFVYNGSFLIADTFSWDQLYHGQTIMEKPLHCGSFYSGQLL